MKNNNTIRYICIAVLTMFVMLCAVAGFLAGYNHTDGGIHYRTTEYVSPTEQVFITNNITTVEENVVETTQVLDPKFERECPALKAPNGTWYIYCEVE